MATIKALPGRLVLRFPKPTEKKGLIYVPETSQLRPEFAEIHDIGEPLDEKETRIATWLRELKAAGKKLCVSVQSGTRYWDDFTAQAVDKEEYGWLADYRVYRLSEPASFLEEDTKT